MATTRTEPLRRELEKAFPSRPFNVTFWDGTELPASDGNGGPTFSVRSPHALAHALRAPGQLGLGRAYAAGALEVDDLDAVLRVASDWQPPAVDRREPARRALAALRACGLTLPPRAPAAELRPRGARH